MTYPRPTTPPVEAKVKTGSLAAGLSAVVLYFVGKYVFGGAVPAGLSAGLESLVVGAAGYAVTFVTGYLTKHTPRDWVDLDVQTEDNPPAA